MILTKSTRGVICTTPIRPIPTNFPPLGSLAIIQSLQKIGIEIEFYNIDYFRYNDAEIEKYFSENQFDFVGISAVVSTAYSFTKKLSSIIKKASPNTVQILGGNLAASAEVILKKTYVDFCVLGDGEIIIQELINALKINNFSVKDKSSFKKIKGITFLEGSSFTSTGYAKALGGSEISFPDYKILEKDGSLNWFMPTDANWTEMNDNKINKAGELKIATAIATKGCVARCTFCHRWEKGFRAKSSGGFKEHLIHLKKEYGVGAIILGDENFGSDKEQTIEIVESLKELGLPWKSAGVRARTITPDLLKSWKSNNAVTIIYGIESGSQTMLDVMQKNVTVEMNSNALKWTSEAGLHTTLQLVIAMPGENDRTIRETGKFIVDHLKYLTPLSNGLPSNSISINYAQSLPGTPLYEYAIQNGFIKSSIDGEEDYLIAISDIDAYSTDHFINYTNQPLLKVLMWRYLLTGPADMFYIKEMLKINLNFFSTTLSIFFIILNKITFLRLFFDKYKIESPLTRKLKKFISEDLKNDEGYFNFKGGWQISLLFTKYYKWVAYPLLALGLAIKRSRNIKECLKLILDHIIWSVFLKKKQLRVLPKTSLRKVVFGDLKFSSPDIQGTMVEIRMGR
jgi:anaerobic magnesium-protoporphyrin IX monomethyl ester cyclase